MNLTAMLVLTTIFIDVSNNLPKTSYMKMMDVWLLFNLIIPFLIVLIHTYMNLKEDDGVSVCPLLAVAGRQRIGIHPVKGCQKS